MVIIGIDPHKASVTAAAVGSASEELGQCRVATTLKTADRLLAWASAWPERVWAVEGASGLGHGVAQQLVAASERVLDVPAKLAARARLLGSARFMPRTRRSCSGFSRTAVMTSSPSAPAP